MSHRYTLIAALATVALVTFGFTPQAWATPSTEDLNAASAKLTSLADSLTATQSDLADKTAQLEQTQADMDDVQSQIDQKQTELDAARAVLSSRMASNYKTGGTSLLDVVFNSTSLEDIINGIYYLNKANDQDAQTISQVTTLQDELSAKKSELAQQQSDLQAAVEKTEQEAESYQNQVAEAQAYYDQLDSEMQVALAEEAAQQAALQAAVQTVDNSSSSSSGSGSSSTAEPDYSVSTGNAVVDRAYSWLKIGKYNYGSCEPGLFDCSGFVSYCLTGVYSRIGTTYTFNQWPEVSDPQPGDVAVVDNDATLRHHTGIYIGNGQMIHASDYGVGVIQSAVRSDMKIVRYPG